MGFLSSSKKNTERIVALFDIGSGSVGGAMVRIPLDDKEIPSIIKSVRTEINTKDTLNFDQFSKDMLQALSTTASSLYESKTGAPGEIICVLASPWHVSETRAVLRTRESSFVFTKNVADEVLREQISLLSSLYKGRYENTTSEPEMIEHLVMGVSLNGYHIEEPLGRHTKSIEMKVLMSLSPKSLLANIRETLSNTYHHIPVSFSSFVALSFIAVRDRYVHADSYVLLDVGGEVTDVTIISKGVLQSSISFPSGKNLIFNYIATKLEVELRDAKELFNLYMTNALSERRKKKVAPLFDAVQNAWMEAFRNAIATLPEMTIIPSTIFLTADEDIRGWFAEAVKNEEYIKSITENHTPSVVTLEGPEFLAMCKIEGGECDPFLMIEAIGIMRKKSN
jgi:cell division ATPase FtsA